MFGFFKQKRRKEWLALPLTDDERALLSEWMPHWDYLGPEEQDRLGGVIQVLRHEKNYEGCGGLELDDGMPLLIAANAGLLIFNRPGNYYPGLSSVLLYPEAFVVRDVHAGEDSLIVQEAEEREGEAWETGAIVLSWEDIMTDMQEFDGRNVVVHEFAHHLHSNAWGPDRSPGLASPQGIARFEAVLQREFEALQRRVHRRRGTFLDPYGAEAPEEFFAVATESFYDLPLEMRAKHPDLYEQLSLFYQCNPAKWFEGGLATPPGKG